VPPTRPKAIFTFFRDWRLPPDDSEDVDLNEEVSDEAFDRHYDNLSDWKDTDPLDPIVDSEHVVVQEFSDILSMLNLTVEDLEKEASMLKQVPDTSSPNKDSSALHAVEGLDAESFSQSLQQQSAALEPAYLRNLSFQGSDMKFIVQRGAEPNSSTEESAPLFVWSKTDPPIKLWNTRPPKGESGHSYNLRTGTTVVFYGSDLAADANHLRSQKDSFVLGKAWKCLSDDAISDERDLFGRFKVRVKDLKRPGIAYLPFVRVWWNFLALYTSRELTYDSDAFLEVNGITSVAQRWTHFRNTFGLWLPFSDKELCWYIDPDVPAVRPKTPQWLAPSWPWASTRGGLVKNAY
jgi:hypothetical protein